MRAMPEWTLLPHQEGLSALEFLRCRLPAAPLAYLRQLLRSEKVWGENGIIRENDLPRAGESLRLPESARLADLLLESAELGVAILWETPQLLAVDKPAGLAVHSSQGHEQDNLLLRIKNLLARRGEQCTPAPIHRLDRDTSGAILFGKNRQAAAALGKIFMAGEVEKTYLALVCGAGAGSGRLSAPVPAKGKIKDAATAFHFLGIASRHSLVALRLETGRTHQIRRHLADLGHPLAGDRRYGGPALAGQTHFFLHCRSLAFADPPKSPQRAILAPLPDEFAAQLDTLGISRPPEKGMI
ncbi:RluA family pseudouridine synthase [Geoalkalibacter sp.]|uniref:RluA family pseudouridine synthase n=1 Tax=Geoalkalibacter sp. TaxID=3041440 RepID=UPI00272E6876|nr:RluA family pseudouridine synthase [Geoalkalibacter sp.]